MEGVDAAFKSNWKTKLVFSSHSSDCSLIMFRTIQYSMANMDQKIFLQYTVWCMHTAGCFCVFWFALFYIPETMDMKESVGRALHTITSTRPPTIVSYKPVGRHWLRINLSGQMKIYLFWSLTVVFYSGLNALTLLELFLKMETQMWILWVYWVIDTFWF